MAEHSLINAPPIDLSIDTAVALLPIEDLNSYSACIIALSMKKFKC